MLNWYALHVRSNHEHLVTEQLMGCDIDGFYPHVVQKSADGKRDIERKFMPGYVFGHFDILMKTPVVAIPQVVSILGWGRHAVPIPDGEIEAVRRIVSFPEVAPAPCPYVEAGDRVRVRRGPLAGLEGYVAYSKNATRVIVSVAMLQRSISAEVDADWLELLERAELLKAA
jgi:transcription antitermination factor NusG